MAIITLCGEGCTRYNIQSDDQFLGRQYDNNAETITVMFPQSEIEGGSSCIMEVIAGNKVVDHIEIVHDTPKLITNVLSRHTEIKIGFSFQRPDGYIKNSEIKKFYFREAIKPDDYVEVEPEQVGVLDTIIKNAVIDVDLNDTKSALEITSANGSTKEIPIPVGDMSEIHTQIDDLGLGIEHLNAEVANVISDQAEMMETLEDTAAIAKGASVPVYYLNYSDMATAFNTLPQNTYRAGQNVMIVETKVPDLWIAEVVDENIPYTYTTDDALVADLNTNKLIQVGYYKLGALETQKVDLTDYVKNTDYATTDTAGVIKTYTAGGNYISNGKLYIARASNSEIDEKTQACRPIVPSNIDYAVKKALADSKLADTDNAWTDEEKTSARTLLGAVGKTDYANSVYAGVVVADSSYGVRMINKYLVINSATDSVIDERISPYRPIVPSNLDYAIKSGLTTNKLTWTEDEKASARTLLGIPKPTATQLGDGSYSITFE